MNRTRLSIPLLALAATAMAPALLNAAESEYREVLGKRVPDFVLPSTTGEQVALSDFNDGTTVVVFLGTSCPVGNAYVPVLADLQKRYADQGVQVLGINSNLQDDAAEIAQHVKDFEIKFPMLDDDDQVVADLFGAQRTPEAFIVNRKGTVLYRGRIDDRFGYTHKNAQPKRHDLEDALKEVLAGKEVTRAEVEPDGCIITRRDRLENRREITWAKHVSRIVHNRCSDCHRPGNAAPFELLTYDDADSWSDMIRETIVDRRMPPWDVDPRHGHFRNDLRMSTEEIDTVLAWIDNGKPMGDKADLPETPTFDSEWQIGEPDMIFKMPEEYTVQATGTVEYQYFITKTNFKEDMWVKASEARPGNWAVVHHIIGFLKIPGQERRRGGNPIIAGYAPGEEATNYQDGIGLRVPAGAEIMWQVHYTPTGKVEKDRSEIGVIFCKDSPTNAVRTQGITKHDFVIPPNAGNHRSVISQTFDRDTELLNLMPHMHLRGSKFKYTAKYPDGTSEVLLNLPNYDFNWQHRYLFATPKFIPKGTTIECVGYFDNSELNPGNPDPSETVTWGDQTWEEMLIGWYEAIDARSKKVAVK